VYDEYSKPIYIVGMLIDINEQKKTLAELKQSEARFRTIFDNTSVGMALINVDGRPLNVNPAILSMTGYSEPELLGMSGLELSHPDDRPALVALLQDLAAGKYQTAEREARLISKDGVVFWVRLRASSVPGQAGIPAYIVVMADDINEQKRIVSELQQSDTRFRAMLDNTSVGISLTGLDRTILQVNEAAARITGYSRDELLKINPVELSVPEDRLLGQEALEAMVRGEREGMTVERRYTRKNGQIFWGRVTYSLVRDMTGAPQYLIGLIEDINEQKLADERLAEQERIYRRSLEQRVEERTHELSEANLRLVNEIDQRHQAEEALAAKAVEEAVQAERTRLAHDLHDAVTQTLFSASLVAEVLPELWEVNPEEARKSNEELRQLTRGALAEMRTLLFELRPAALTQANFPDLIRQLCEAVIGQARLMVNLSVEGEYELPVYIKIAFYRIAQESLNNIVKYSKANQVEIKVRLERSMVNMEISDNGIGFDPDNIKRTSLGMRIMRDRAQVIGAALAIDSQPGQGTTVTVNWNGDNTSK